MPRRACRGPPRRMPFPPETPFGRSCRPAADLDRHDRRAGGSRPALRQLVRAAAGDVLHAPAAHPPARSVPGRVFRARGQPDRHRPRHIAIRHRGGSADRQSPGRGLRASRGGLFRPPVRRLRAPARGRPGDPDRRGGRAGRTALGTAAEGRRQDAVLAHGRRPRGAALVDPRVPVLGSAASPRNSVDPRARDRRLGHAGDARDRRDRGRRHPHVAEFRPLRVLRVLLLDRAARCAEATGRLRDRPVLPGKPRSAPALPARPRAGGAPGRRAWSRNGRGGFLPRRAEHRRHVDPRADDRLRAVRLHGRVRCRLRLQPQRLARSLRLQHAAADRALEPLCARPGAGAADGGPRRDQGRDRHLRRGVFERDRRCLPRQARTVDAAGRRRGPREWPDRPAECQPHGLDALLAPAVATACRCRRLRAGRAGARPRDRPAGVRRLGGDIPRPAACRAQRRCRATRADGSRESRVRAAQSPRRDRDPQGARRRDSATSAKWPGC